MQVIVLENLSLVVTRSAHLMNATESSSMTQMHHVRSSGRSLLERSLDKRSGLAGARMEIRDLAAKTGDQKRSLIALAREPCRSHGIPVRQQL
jgi:hypothetical protein